MKLLDTFYMSNIKECAREYLDGHDHELFCEMIDRIGKPRTMNNPPNIYLWYGTGANGKTTLLNNVGSVFKTEHVETLLSSKYNEGVELLRWNEYEDDTNIIGKLKQYVSGDAIYQYVSENDGVVKLPDISGRADVIVVTNSLSIHTGILRRAKVVNFTRTFRSESALAPTSAPATL